MTDAIAGASCVAVPSIHVGLPGRRVYEEGMDSGGGRQLEADTYVDELLPKRLRTLDGVGKYASEERPDVTGIGEGVSVALDPFDGSTNLKPNNVVGMLCSIYDEPLPVGGGNLLAAGYIPYGPTTTPVAGRDDVVSEHILESSIKHPFCGKLTLLGDPAISSSGDRVNRWSDDFEVLACEIERTEGMKLRYGGPTIGDMNQILYYGGVFVYLVQIDASNGELCQQFEGFPIGCTIGRAGGRSPDGEQSLLSGTLEDIHDRVSVYIDNDSLVELLGTRLD